MMARVLLLVLLGLGVLAGAGDALPAAPDAAATEWAAPGSDLPETSEASPAARTAVGPGAEQALRVSRTETPAVAAWTEGPQTPPPEA